jgi:beta-galactosidase
VRSSTAPDQVWREDYEIGPDFGLRLNGQKVILKGIANHHTLGALGAAAYPRAMEKRLQLLKDFGFNHVRTSHNPYSQRVS